MAGPCRQSPIFPPAWEEAVSGLSAEDLQRRPICDMWSIAEYADHVRVVLFGMRFLLHMAVGSPGSDLGDPPDAPFEPEPRVIDVPATLSRIAHEAHQLHDQLVEVPPAAWTSAVVVGGQEVDSHWIARHAVHDASHHLDDVVGLRQTL